MKILAKSTNIAADAHSAPTAATKETPQGAVTAATTPLPDPDRGERLVIPRSELELMATLLSSDERHQVLDSMCSWMVGGNPAVNPALSESGSLMLKRLMEGQRRSARMYRMRVEAQIAKAERRRNRLARIGRAK